MVRQFWIWPINYQKDCRACWSMPAKVCTVPGCPGLPFWPSELHCFSTSTLWAH